MVFFSFVVTPVAFRRLDPEAGSALIRALFPVYYRTMAVLAVGTSLFANARSESLALAVIGLGFVAVMLVLRPLLARARAARERGDFGGEVRFRRLHGLSMIVNLAQMAGVTWVFVRLAA
jgi:hypothetical protein